MRRRWIALLRKSLGFHWISHLRRLTFPQVVDVLQRDQGDLGGHWENVPSDQREDEEKDYTEKEERSWEICNTMLGESH